MEKNIIDNFNYLSDRVNSDSIEIFTNFFENIKKNKIFINFMRKELDNIDFLNQNIMDNILSNMYNRFHNLIISSKYKHKIRKYFDNLNQKDDIYNISSANEINDDNNYINKKSETPNIILWKLNPYDNFYNENELNDLNDYNSFDDGISLDGSSEDEENTHIEY